MINRRKHILDIEKLDQNSEKTKKELGSLAAHRMTIRYQTFFTVKIDSQRTIDYCLTKLSYNS